MNNRNLLLSFIVFITVIVVFVFAGHLLEERNIAKVTTKNNERILLKNNDEDALSDSIDDIYERDSFDGSIFYEGVRYEPNTHIEKILFLGIDSTDQSREGVGIVEGGRSDTIILFSIDNQRKLITPIEINRDTMVNVDIYDNTGTYISNGTEQLTMQYSYGRSVSQACNLTKDKVSDLFCRTKINGVVSLTMDGIEPIVDSIGGITIKLMSDETQINPEYVKGAIVHMDGATAKDFVHKRDISTRGSNIERMSRQTQFMIALFQNIKMNGDFVIEKIEEAADGYLYKDLDADTIKHFSEYDYAGNVILLPGKNITDGIHDEFYINENEMTKLVLDLFYSVK